MSHIITQALCFIPIVMKCFLVSFSGNMMGQTSPTNPAEKSPEALPGQAKMDSTRVQTQIHTWLFHNLSVCVVFLILSCLTDRHTTDHTHFSRAEETVQHQAWLWHVTQSGDDPQLTAEYKGNTRIRHRSVLHGIECALGVYFKSLKGVFLLYL